MSPYIGAENIISLNEGLKIGEKRYNPIEEKKMATYFGKSVRNEFFLGPFKLL